MRDIGLLVVVVVGGRAGDQGSVDREPLSATRSYRPLAAPRNSTTALAAWPSDAGFSAT